MREGEIYRPCSIITWDLLQLERVMLRLEENGMRDPCSYLFIDCTNQCLILVTGRGGSHRQS